MRDLIEHVGAERFERACRDAWNTAAGTGSRRDEGEVCSDAADVPHDLADLIWFEGDAAWADRVALAFALYRRMPSYANLMYATGHATWDDRARRLFWDEYRALLDEPDDRLGDPVAYSLWCDYFEDPATVGLAWHEVAEPGQLGEHGLRRLLDAAGPVPFDLKARLYERLSPDDRWHEPIFRSLSHSAHDVYGKLDVPAARDLLARLVLPDETEGLDDLRRRLRS